MGQNVSLVQIVSVTGRMWSKGIGKRCGRVASGGKNGAAGCHVGRERPLRARWVLDPVLVKCYEFSEPE